MFHKGKDIVGLSLTEEFLKIAHFRMAGQEWKVAGVLRKDIHDVSEEELPAVLSKMWAELGLKKAGAFCVIPSGLVITKNIEIPSLDPEEIRSIIDLQAGRHTPYSREEILVGYISIGVFQRNYTKILLIIVNREIIKKQMAIFDNASIQIDKVIFAPEPIALFYAQALSVKEGDTPVGIIDIDYNMTNFIIEFNGTVATCRSIPLGISQLQQEGAEAQKKFMEEIARSLESYQGEDINKDPALYVFSRAQGPVQELQGAIKEKFKVETQVSSYLELMACEPAAGEKIKGEWGEASFLDLIAAGKMLGGIQVDLLPEEVKTQRAIQARGREIIRTGFLCVFFLLLVCAVFFTKVFFKKLYSDRVNEEYLQKRRQVILLDRLAQKTQIIKDFVNSRMVSLEVIKEIYRLIPDEIYLQSIFLDENGTINLQGISDSMSVVFNFVSSLDKSDLFKNVNPKSTTDAKDRGKDVAAFTIEFQLESAQAPIPEESEAVEEAAE